ncbi:MAG TPA: metallophosphoesterase, partial [Candidatus Limnocylindria bacterium]|nr:metallophosphoesterase [Candidatus Limnocylindria bacterium]
CLFGHTHVPVIYHDAGEAIDTIAATPDRSISLGGGRAMLNPGSVGQPRDGNPASSYLLLDIDLAIAEFRRISYDVSRTQHLMREAGLPARLIERLSWGR